MLAITVAKCSLKWLPLLVFVALLVKVWCDGVSEKTYIARATGFGRFLLEYRNVIFCDSRVKPTRTEIPGYSTVVVDCIVVS